jgi:hypothetical protein
MWQRVSILVIGLFSSGCAAASSSTRPMKSASRDVITAAEIVASRVTDVYQAVVQLRPEFLRKRSAAPIAPYRAPQVIVYLDDLEFGAAESMRHIPLVRVRQIRYMSATEADLRWGGRHPAGAIHVSTLR